MPFSLYRSIHSPSCWSYPGVIQEEVPRLELFFFVPCVFSTVLSQCLPYVLPAKTAQHTLDFCLLKAKLQVYLYTRATFRLPLQSLEVDAHRDFNCSPRCYSWMFLRLPTTDSAIIGDPRTLRRPGIVFPFSLRVTGSGFSALERTTHYDRYFLTFQELHRYL